MRLSVVLLLVICVVLAVSWPRGAVPKSQVDELNRRLEQVQAQLKETEGKLAAAEPVHNYSTFSKGPRQWRFDSATGRSCIMLTTAEDWKKVETVWQSCDCVDAMAEYWNRKENQNGDDYNGWVKSFCTVSQK